MWLIFVMIFFFLYSQSLKVFPLSLCSGYHFPKISRADNVVPALWQIILFGAFQTRPITLQHVVHTTAVLSQTT